MKADSCTSDSLDKSVFEVAYYVTIGVQTEEYTTTNSKKGVTSKLDAFLFGVGMELNKNTRASIKNTI